MRSYAQKKKKRGVGKKRKKEEPLELENRLRVEVSFEEIPTSWKFAYLKVRNQWIHIRKEGGKHIQKLLGEKSQNTLELNQNDQGSSHDPRSGVVPLIFPS